MFSSGRGADKVPGEVYLRRCATPGPPRPLIFWEARTPSSSNQPLEKAPRSKSCGKQEKNDPATRPLLTDQPFLNGTGDQGGGVVDIQFAHEVLSVGFDGVGADVQCVCDFLVRVTFCNEFEDFTLLRG